MDTKFNFYDLYGYLLPGVVFVMLFAVALNLAGVTVPSVGLGEALVLFSLAYVIGHLLQAWSRPLFVTEWVHGKEGRIPPTAFYLLERSGRFTDDDRRALCAAAKLTDPAAPTTLDVENVFEVTRSRAVQAGKAAYFEQKQGMYAFMQGVGTSALFATAGSVGAALAPLISSFSAALPFTCGGLLGMLIVLEYLDDRSRTTPFSRYGPARSTELWFKLAPRLLLSMTVMAWVVLSVGHPTRHEFWGPFAWALACLLLFFRSRVGFKQYTGQFAYEVYRAFLDLDPKKKT